MQEISQRELLREGFLDTIRKIASPIVRGAAGIARVVAPNLSREIGSDIQKLKFIGKNTKSKAKRKQYPRQTVTKKVPTNPTSTTAPASPPKLKFYESLRDWKTKNIGPNAASIGITYKQLKDFLTSIKVQDPDRVLKSAGIQDKGAQTIPNTSLSGVEATLKSRGVVAESSQINLIKQLNLMKDSYNKIYELSKHKNN